MPTLLSIDLLIGLLTCFGAAAVMGRVLKTRMAGAPAAFAVAGVAVVEIGVNSVSKGFGLPVLPFLFVVLNPALEETVRFRFGRRDPDVGVDPLSVTLMLATVEAMSKTISMLVSLPIRSPGDPLVVLLGLAILISFVFHANMGLVLVKLTEAERSLYPLALMVLLHGSYNLLVLATEPPSLVAKNIHLAVLAVLNGACLLWLLRNRRADHNALSL